LVSPLLTASNITQIQSEVQLNFNRIRAKFKHFLTTQSSTFHDTMQYK